MLDRIACMHSFVRAVETGSFSTVAQEMGTTQPTISKQIAALEAHLGVQLLRRSTRKLGLTDEGSSFYEHCRRVLETLAEAESSVGNRRRPSGVLRVNCSVAYGQMEILPRLPRFLDRYPELRIDLTMSDRYVSFVEEDIDLAIRIGNYVDRSLIVQPLSTTRFVTVGAMSYFEKFPEPQVPADLMQHNCIVYTQQSTVNEWHYGGPDGAIAVVVSGNLQVNNSAALRDAVSAGIGIGASPIWAFRSGLRDRTLKLVLENYEPAPLPIQVVYRRSRFLPVKVQRFIEFLSLELCES